MVFDPKKLSLVGIMSPHRRLPEPFEATVKKYSAQVGEVIWAWNYCHAALANLFYVIVSPQNLMLGHAIWHTSQSDAAQREFLLASAKVSLAKKPRMLAKIEWAKQNADKLSVFRNDTAHLATSFSGRPSDLSLVPSFLATAPKRLRRLENRDLEEMLFLLRGDLIALAGYVLLLGGKITFPEHYTLPRRPKLLSIQDQRSTKKRRRTRTADPRPPRSSRA